MVPPLVRGPWRRVDRGLPRVRIRRGGVSCIRTRLTSEVDFGLAGAGFGAGHRVGLGCGGGSLAAVSKSGGSPGSSLPCGPSTFGPKLFIDAVRHRARTGGAFDSSPLTRVPSTGKWSSDGSGFTSRWARTAAMTLRDISVFNRRSRFFVNTVGTQTGSSIPGPKNQWNSRLYCICSINCRPDRIANRIWIRPARISRSDTIEGRSKST